MLVGVGDLAAPRVWLPWLVSRATTSSALSPSLLPRFKGSPQVKGGHFNDHLPCLGKWQGGLSPTNRIDFFLNEVAVSAQPGCFNIWVFSDCLGLRSWEDWLFML